MLHSFLKTVSLKSSKKSLKVVRQKNLYTGTKMLPHNSADIQLNPLDKRKPTEYSSRVFVRKTFKSLLKDISAITKQIKSLFFLSPL